MRADKKLQKINTWAHQLDRYSPSYFDDNRIKALNSSIDQLLDREDRYMKKAPVEFKNTLSKLQDVRNNLYENDSPGYFGEDMNELNLILKGKAPGSYHYISKVPGSKGRMDMLADKTKYILDKVQSGKKLSLNEVDELRKVKNSLDNNSYFHNKYKGTDAYRKMKEAKKNISLIAQESLSSTYRKSDLIVREKKKFIPNFKELKNYAATAIISGAIFLSSPLISANTKKEGPIESNNPSYTEKLYEPRKHTERSYKF
jgi:hypothetical protein